MLNKGKARLILAASALALASGANAGETVTYGYDALGRLVATTTSGTVNNGLTTSLGYDSAGNRACYRVAGSAGPCPPPPPSPDPAPPPAMPTIGVGSSSAAEGTPLVFTLTKSGSAAATVSWSTVDGTAVSGTDYTGAAGTVSFAAGETTKTVSIPTTTDSVLESSETLTLHLFDPVGAVLANAVGTGTIGEATISIGDASASEGSPLVFTVTRTGGGAATASWSTLDQTAVAGSDYVAATGTVSFADGESTKTISIGTLTDSAAEVTETMRVQLNSSTGASLYNAVGTGSILDVAGPPPPGNTPPTAVNDTGSIPRCQTKNFNVIANDYDTDGDVPLTLDAVQGDHFSKFSDTEIQVDSEFLSSGDSATYVVKDSRGATATGTLTVTISGGRCN